MNLISLRSWLDEKKKSNNIEIRINANDYTQPNALRFKREAHIDTNTKRGRECV